MGYNYDFYKSPVPNGSNRQPRLHARLVPLGTVDLNELAEDIQEGSSATTGDITLVMTQVIEKMARYLSDGWRIHINGLGYFEITLENPPISNPKEIRSESISVKSISFRPDVNMKRRLGRFKAVRSERKNHSKNVSNADICSCLSAYFVTHETLRGSDLCKLFGLTSTTASRRLKQLVEDGMLQKTGYPRMPLYVRGKNLP